MEFRTHIKEAQWTPIESPVRSGVPDHEYCFPNGAAGWIEHKFTRTGRVPRGKMRPFQVQWLDRRRRLGGRAFVAVRQERRGEDKLFLFDGLAARHLATGPFDDVPVEHVLGAYGGGPSGWDWDHVRQVLGGEPRKSLGE